MVRSKTGCLGRRGAISLLKTNCFMFKPTRMKRNITRCLTLFLCLSAVADAQVKIGDNPNTINSNSLFEMESTSKGLVIPRMALNNASSASPLSGTVPTSVLVYSTGGTLTDGYYYWEGAKWVRLVTSANQRSNYVLVKSASDFPAPVAGVITLAATTVYEINGTISLSDKIDLNGSWITGMDAVNDKLVYTPTSGELFTGANGGNIRQVTMVAAGVGAKLFNIDAGGANKNLIIQNCYIANCDNIGLIKGFGGTIYISTVAFLNNTNGVTFQDENNLALFNLLWDSNNHNTYEKYVGTFSIIHKMAGDMLVSSANSAVAMDISGITSLTAGELKTVFFTGTGTYLSGSFSSTWEVESTGINNEKDDVAAGNVYVSTAVATTFTAVNTPTKILGTTTAASLFRVSSPANNRMTYTGVKTRRFQVICSLSLVAAANNKYFSFYIAKNGTILAESKQSLKLGSNDDKGSVTLSCTVQLAANDYIEVWVENNSDATSVTVETLNLAVK
ncbi:MAG: hypothetical protein FD123_2333 [Bacteroidetes bacterium]|nr:MAG: hypothetical protein FD123_2333 [Bacteroidota bacterium]